MEEVVFSLLGVFGALAATGVFSLFKGDQLRDWVRKKETAAKAAYRADTKTLRASQAAHAATMHDSGEMRH